jgi:hypothetical protein
MMLRARFVLPSRETVHLKVFLPGANPELFR